MNDYKDSLFQKINFNVKYSVKNKQTRGLYLRNADELYKTRDYLITLEPVFFENKLTESSKEEQLNINSDSLLKSINIFVFHNLFLYKFQIIYIKKLSKVKKKKLL